MYVRKIKLGDDVLLLPDPTDAIADALANKADYEEGDWTPKISLTSDGSQIVPDHFDGKYKRIGKEVHIKAYLDYTALEASSTLYLQGIPFPPIFPYSRMGKIFVGTAIINNVTAKSVSAGTDSLIIELPSETSASNIDIDIIYWN